MLYGLLGGAAYWWFFMRPKGVQPATQQVQLTTEVNPPQMQTSPGIQGIDFYDVGAFPMGAFAER